MIHVIYIYLIINSFIVGHGWKCSKDWKVHLVFLLFGLPITVSILSYELLHKYIKGKL